MGNGAKFSAAAPVLTGPMADEFDVAPAGAAEHPTARTRPDRPRQAVTEIRKGWRIRTFKHLPSWASAFCGQDIQGVLEVVRVPRFEGDFTASRRMFEGKADRVQPLPREAE